MSDLARRLRSGAQAFSMQITQVADEVARLQGALDQSLVREQGLKNERDALRSEVATLRQQISEMTRVH